ncbi:MAG: endonuclease III [Pirellulaceae bacterium]|jgi:endonuclease-3|nr:endonuclease III [Pirellulaceae bacterium]MDP7020526.1 endonuclease III [Pirellulaceae bacterium]
MKKHERAEIVQDRLDELYPLAAAPLDHVDPFTLLVAVLLSAQCTDKRVNQVTPALFQLADNPFAMARLTAKRIQRVIRSCGLSETKSKAIRSLSQILVDEHGGEVPDNFDDLETLPGVGHKTASVVMAQAFGHPAFPVDTHIHRLAQRWGLSSGKNVVQTERDLKKLFAAECWHRLHLQIIFYGRDYCTARGCDGTVCPMCRELYPRRRKPVTTKK